MMGLTDALPDRAPYTGILNDDAKKVFLGRRFRELVPNDSAPAGVARGIAVMGCLRESRGAGQTPMRHVSSG